MGGEPDPVLAGALDLISWGLRAIPLHGMTATGECTCGNGCGRSAGKHPRFSGWQNTQLADHDQVTTWWKKWPRSNVGVATGHGIMVVDVDQHDADGHASLAQLQQIYGPLPPTRTAITGSGGLHLYYRVTRTIKNSAGKIAPGIDIRGDGGQVVAPPSMHKSGNRYHWDNTSPSYLAEAPPWLMDLAEKAGAEEKPAPPTQPRARARKGDKDSTAWLDNWMAKNLGRYTLEGPQPYDGGRKWIFPVCPWNPEHTNKSAFLVQRADGTIQAGCHHAGCSAHDWQSLRTLVGAPKTTRTQDDEPPPPGDECAPPERDGDDPGEDQERIDGTDLASARLLLELRGKDIHWVEHWGTWFGWSGRVWETDETGKVRLGAQAVITELQRRVDEASKDLEAAKEKEDKEELGAAKKAWAAGKRWLERVSNVGGFKAMLEMAKHQPAVSLKTEDLDRNPLLLGVSNGTLDLVKGTLLASRREDLITKTSQIAYDKNATCPHWDEFVSLIMQGNQGLISYLQRAVGYSLTGSVVEQCFFFCYGAQGANGKSTFLEVLMRLLGDYAKPIESSVLMASKGDKHPVELANLLGARLVTSIETGQRRLDEEKIKWITGSDRLTARFMRENYFTFLPSHKLWIAGNHKPVIRGTDPAIWRRVQTVPFHHVFLMPDTTFLQTQLIPELPGILAWAVRGCLAWQNMGLQPPQEVVAATQEYRKEQDVLSHFIEECCQVGRSLRVEYGALYKAYKEWSTENGEFVESSRSFSARLTERGFEHSRSTGGKLYKSGIGLASDFNSTGFSSGHHNPQDDIF